MSWIESHQSLSRHKKTLRAASLLKVDRHKLIGHLHELWWWGLDNADIDGNLTGITESEIAAAAGWQERQASKFVGSLVAARFIDVVDDDYRLHNWYKYAGKLNVRRESDRERAKIRRASSGNPADIPPTSEGPSAGTVPTVPNQPNRTEPDQSEADASPATAVPRKPARQVRRMLDAEAIAQIQAEPENVDVDVAAVAADYLNWTGSDKHRDQVQALRNQLDIPGKRERFRRRGATGPALTPYETDTNYSLAVQRLVRDGHCRTLPEALEKFPYEKWLAEAEV